MKSTVEEYPKSPTVASGPVAIQAQIWTLPNALSLLRIFLTPFILVVLLTRVADFEFIALIIFWIASGTDLLDGLVARRRGQQTSLGAMLDPLADKLLICSVFIAFVELRLAPAWMVAIIVGRELIITGLRAIRLRDRRPGVGAARWLGKWKFFIQVTTVSILILSYRYTDLYLPAQLALWIMLIFTLVSLMDYLFLFFRRLRTLPDTPVEP